MGVIQAAKFLVAIFVLFLARLLGDLGYDVWMLNYRGTWYSKGHVNLTTEDPNYWKYT